MERALALCTEGPRFDPNEEGKKLKEERKRKKIDRFQSPTQRKIHSIKCFITQML